MTDPQNLNVGGIGRGSPPGMPRWVKVVGLVLLAALVLVAFILVGGGHGPGLHASIGDTADSGPALAKPAGD